MTAFPLCEQRHCLILQPAGPLVHGGKLLDSLARSGDIAALYRQTNIVTLDPGGLLPDEVEKFLEKLPPLEVVKQEIQHGLFDE